MIMVSECFIPIHKMEKNMEFGILVLYIFGFACLVHIGDHISYRFNK